ncbi:MAG: RNA methyltransferase [Kiritimatiellaeota bacterium]|nr:RNA methyltransferase [Kiritimatiellota bacterium]
MFPLTQFQVVLVSPLYAANIGSVCRVMANCGLSRLSLVAPQCVDGWDEAPRLACHATNILDAAQRFDTLDDALADSSIVVGTTARGGLYRQHVGQPRETMPKLLEQAGRGAEVALVFGREDTGLLNDEILRCNHLLQIPSHPSYLSLNLAQAVLLCCHELFLAADVYEPPVEKSAFAPASQRERCLAMWREMLLATGFMEPEKADHMMQAFQRVFSRGAETCDDINILMGVARQVRWATKR